MSTIIALTLWLILCACTAYQYARRRRRNYPPGPQGLPILGNLLDMPHDKEGLKYTQWAREYGDMYHLSVLGTHIFIINTPEVANDLFVKRSSNYSDRDRMTMINELMGWDFSFAMMRFGDRWKTHSKMFTTHFRFGNISSYHTTQRDCTYDLLRDLLESPQNLHDHLKHLMANAVTQIMYGIPVAKSEDHYAAVADQAFNAMTNAASPGTFLVDVFPILKHAPAWLPGADFQRKAKEWKKLTLEMVDAPYRAAQRATVEGNVRRCFVTEVTSDLERLGANKDQYEVLRNCAGLGFAAGVQTTSTSLMSLFLALMLYPDVQKRAQDELDRVCNGRLPDFSDRPALPYVDALCAELSRWGVVAPLGVPHVASRDDVYRGYDIPAGSIMIDAQIFITAASILRVFVIKPLPGPWSVRPKYEDLFSFRPESHPIPFKCQIIPRGESEIRLIQNSLP
ncbi:hypothetical protein NLI96_g9763 [Meripilus lineatus]|uniref:Cytochrome P450 n=1 Tax=Meripilus lineatus TaxID=2056292 RepID=A0AAD5YEX4_9APHY|nr:hypothetical protein NLI96_g9763 [Physisporinus lineatus]